MAYGSADVWTADRLFAGSDDTAAALRAADWAATPLGPVETWPVELRAAVRTVLPSRRPMLLWWGPRLVQIFNHAYTPVLGDKYPAAIGQPGAECWAEVWDQLGPLADHVLRGEGAIHLEDHQLMLRRHGYLEETYWTFSYSPVTDEAGRVVGIFVSTTDVTTRVLGDRRLGTLRRLSTVSVTEADSVADACRSAVARLAESRADLPFVAAYLWRDADRLDLAASFGTEQTIPAGEGSVVRRVAETSAAERMDSGVGDSLVLPLVVTEQPRPIGALVAGISPYRAFDDAYAAFLHLVAGQVSAALADARVYESQRRRLAELSELDAAKTRFFENVSHEFRTPLTLLLAPIQDLLDHDGHLTEDQRGAIAAAYRAALRLRRLVDGLLDVASAEAHQLHVQPEPTDPVALTKECASMFRSAAEAAGLKLLLELDDDAREPVALDQDMWTKIVLNLLSNAVKYTPAGTITVRLDAADGELRLTVADTGVGIAAEEQPRVFDRFHRVAGSGGRSSEGVGIGLSLVSLLARALGGSVSLHSTPGQGSTFTVTVPRKPSDSSVAKEFDVAELGAPYLTEAQRWQAENARTIPGGDPGDGRILLVEDNADMRGYLSRLLHEQGWTVDAVSDAAAALAHAEANPPDLILSDIMLPGTDGLELLRTVRQDQRLVRVPVVLLTARAGATSATDGLRLGADDYVVKPFDPAELVARVRVHLELSRLRESLIASSDDQARTLRRALDTRSTISQAVGLLMALHRCDAETAFNKLAELSKNGNVKVRVLAERMVAEFTESLTIQ
ncbi:ATP-binding protein [Labedaea rhizosphaerae]|uniref:histidine kinase n=1 Tax=Labedaea rhizosphaerae TaxID=598644 RepID=A0A4R6SJ06_LABRH|nr:ATP-binding protein [Labedaea rhizosphaerae]TDQ00899.1 response regulator receiver and ANTAR domain protein [Labedaea rhizosphaerae]